MLLEQPKPHPKSVVNKATNSDKGVPKKKRIVVSDDDSDDDVPLVFEPRITPPNSRLSVR